MIVATNAGRSRQHSFEQTMIGALSWILAKMEPMKVAEDLEKEWVVPVLKNRLHWHLVVVNMNKHSTTLCDSIAQQNVPSDDELREMGALFGCLLSCLACNKRQRAA